MLSSLSILTAALQLDLSWWGRTAPAHRLWSAQRQQTASEKLGSAGHGGCIGGCALPCFDVPYQIWPEVI